jgi:2-phospho-L-lactate/phosphoenolpyruvate guanylyltransferase
VSTRVIVPHRGLEAAKTRLAGVLSPGERGELAARLLDRVLRVARVAVPDVVVISPSEALAGLVEATGSRLEVQRGMGLNEGLDQSRAAAVADGVTTLVILHGDLPSLTVEDVSVLATAIADARGVAIATDRAGTGTNGLALRPPEIMRFAFGPGSCAAHRDNAAAAEVIPVMVTRPGLAFDLDTPEDLVAWLATEVPA